MLWKQPGFDKWDLIGLSKVGDLWARGGVVPLSDLQQQYQLHERETFRYLQVRSALTKVLPRGTELPVSSPLEDRLLDDYLLVKAVSLTYRKILNNSPDPLEKVRIKWSEDVGEITDEEWREALASPREVAIRSWFKLIQLKVLHRAYYTSSALVKMGLIGSPICPRGCGQVGTYLHQW